MHQVYFLFSGFSNWWKVTHDDDTVDRWNRIYTIVILIIIVMFVTTNNYVGEPVICWNQGSLSGHDSYINTICWISNTYWLPFQDPIPQNIPDREKLELNYYQWIPIILILQALMFYMPRIVWRTLRERTGINIKRINVVASEQSILDPNNRNKTIAYLADHFNDALEMQREYRERDLIMKMKAFLARHVCCIFCFGKRNGTSLFNIYIFVKMLYIVNAIGQIALIDRFLQGSWASMYGIEILQNFKHKHAWRVTGKLPRVTMCDFDIRVLGNLHRHTVQCVLPINMFNEKIYLFLWFWFVMLAIASSLSAANWYLRVGIKRNRLNFLEDIIRRQTNIEEKSDFPRNLTSEENKLIEKFSENHLRKDGSFALQMIKHNTNEMIISGLTYSVYKKFEKKHKGKNGEINPLNKASAPTASNSGSTSPETPLKS